MQWVIVQLSVWARTHLPSDRIEAAIMGVLHQAPLYIYIPVYEDLYGKKDYGFGEYAFINYDPETDYYILEELDEVVRILKDPHTKKPFLLTNEQVWDIKNKSDLECELHPDDVVKIISGPARDNYGVVLFVAGDTVRVEVQIGQEKNQATVPVQHVRKSRKKTFQRKHQLEDREFHLDEPENHVQRLNFGDTPRIQILRRGQCNTKVSIDNKVRQVPNEWIDKILLSSNILDDNEFIDQVNSMNVGNEEIDEDGSV
jgi:hypothetical protein